MKFLLDTDTCIFWLRGQQSVRDHIVTVGLQAIGISIVTLAELRYGAVCSARPEANHQAIDAFISGITVVGLDPAITNTFAAVKADLRQRGMLIDDFDLLIAATARTYHLTLVTNNAQHFSRIPDLLLANWS